MNKPTMKPAALSTVYLDNQRIGLMGDPRPVVAKIVAAGGRAPHAVQVLRSRSPDSAGTPVQLDDVIDRTAEPTKAIYLTCKATTMREPLPAQPRSVPARPEPAPERTDVRKEPEWGV